MAAIVAKRINLPGARDKEAEEAAERLADEQARAARLVLHREQVSGYQDAARTYLVRFARGVTLWQEKGWAWATPAPATSPESWPPLAKTLWLREQFEYCMAALAQLWIGTKVMWCSACNEDAPCPEDAYRWACLQHTKSNVLATGAAEMLFGIAREVER